MEVPKEWKGTPEEWNAVVEAFGRIAKAIQEAPQWSKQIATSFNVSFCISSTHLSTSFNVSLSSFLNVVPSSVTAKYQCAVALIIPLVSPT